MIILWIILGVYLISVVAIYYIARFMYLTNNNKGPIAPLWWICPLVNTCLVVIGFIYCAKDIPVLGITFWNKRWDKLKKTQ